MFPFIGTYLKNSINIQQKKDKLTHMQLLKPSIDASFFKRLGQTPRGSFLRNKQDLKKNKQSRPHHKRVNAQQLFGTYLKLQKETMPY